MMRELGQIEADGIAARGAALASGLESGVQGYFKGKEAAEGSEAHRRRMELSEEDLAATREDNRILDKSEEDGVTLREHLIRSKLQKGATPETARWRNTGKLTKDGKPLLYDALTGAFKAGEIEADKREGAYMTPYQQEMLQLQRDAKEDRKEAKTAETLDKNTTKYSESLAKSNVPTAVSQLERIFTLLPPEAGSDAPGYGRVAGAAPDWMVSQKGEDLRQAVATLFNIELKDRSGAAVTDTELDRLKREFGQGAWKTPDQLRKGIAQYEARLQEVMRNITAGYDPTVPKEYVSRGGRDFGNWKGRGFPKEKTKGKAIAAPGPGRSKDLNSMTDQELEEYEAKLKAGVK